MKIKYRAKAIADLGGIQDYISTTNPLAAQRVNQRVFQSIQRLKLFPAAGRPGIVEGTRELVVPGLPYIVVYAAQDDVIDIIAVFHAARKR